MAGWLSFVGARREDEQTFTIEQPVIFFLYEIKPAQQTTERPQIDAPPTPEKRKSADRLMLFCGPGTVLVMLSTLFYINILFLFLYLSDLAMRLRHLTLRAQRLLH